MVSTLFLFVNAPFILLMLCIKKRHHKDAAPTHILINIGILCSIVVPLLILTVPLRIEITIRTIFDLSTQTPDVVY